jgi:hypothetical protein
MRRKGPRPSDSHTRKKEKVLKNIFLELDFFLDFLKRLKGLDKKAS